MQDTATQTLLALEQRLRRLTFLLHGHDSADGADGADEAAATSVADEPSAVSIASRLQSIEKALQAVAAQSDSAAELLRLRECFRPLIRPGCG